MAEFPEAAGASIAVCSIVTWLDTQLKDGLGVDDDVFRILASMQRLTTGSPHACQGTWANGRIERLPWFW
ncbi:hypothetical protein, partial [Candidatus Synechococcus spongiarum]|uniref:hypothetical protein n=1 Tax=Candidatus Synechococcus spongiarum TaxID=431041 RepID=UPI001C5ABB8C